MDFKVQVPAGVELTKEKGWSHPEKYLYFMARLNLHVEQYQAENPVYFGEVLRPFRTTDFSETRVIETFEEECTVVSAEETTRSTLIENEVVAGIASEIGGGIELPAYTLSAKVGSTYQEKIKTGISASLKNVRTITRREKKSFEIQQSIVKGAKELIYAVAGYKRYRWDVYLHYIDYLFVEYRRSMLKLRKRKINMPRPHGPNHINRIKVNMPLFTISYWELDPKSSLLFTESEYKGLPHKIKNPDRAVIEELHTPINLPLPSRPDRPTLYTLSNIAFPLRWIDRQGDWTKEELAKIELEEAEGSAWWFQYGPGRNKHK